MSDKMRVRCPDCGGERIDVYQTQETCESVEVWQLDEAGLPEVEEYGKASLIDVTTTGYRCDAFGCPGDGRLLQASDLVIVKEAAA